jgi:ketosteroid isomerase-like protein
VTTFARKATDAFYEVINAGRYDEVGDLFAEDAVFLAPNGQMFTGRKEIHDFYSWHLNRLRPAARISRHMETDTQCVVEISNENGETGEYELTAINYFTFRDDGKVQRLDIFVRGTPDAVERVISTYGAEGAGPEV